MIANHRAGLSKPCLQAPKLIVNSLPSQSKFGNFRSPLIPFLPRIAAMLGQRFVGLAYCTLNCHRTHDQLLRSPPLGARACPAGLGTTPATCASLMPFPAGCVTAGSCGL